MRPPLRLVPAGETPSSGPEFVHAHVPAPTVYVRRGPFIESVHRLAIAIVDAAGRLFYTAGDTDRVLPVRSLAKPFIAAELIRSGAANAFGLTDAHIALAAGSHDGAQIHIDCARDFLEHIGLTPSALECGARVRGAVPLDPEANNCSGKHAAVLALSKHWGFALGHYIDVEHPVQRRLQPILQRAFDADMDGDFAIDGCGMPIFAASLAEIARAYSRFVQSDEVPERRVRSAVAHYPTLFGGECDNFDSALARASRGAVFGKLGAEGLHADAVAHSGFGIAVKVIDGNPRAQALVVPALLQRYAGAGILESLSFGPDGTIPLLNSAGVEVGTMSMEGI